jgi:hypothetical protein
MPTLEKCLYKVKQMKLDNLSKDPFLDLGLLNVEEFPAELSKKNTRDDSKASATFWNPSYTGCPKNNDTGSRHLYSTDLLCVFKD